MKIRRGISRTCLLIGPWAIKVPTTRPYGERKDRLWAWTRGYQANHSELEWCKVEGVCPVRWHLGTVVVAFQRCTEMREDECPDPDDRRSWWNDICPMLIFGDRKASNLGRMPDGRIVWIDYDGSWNGCPHSRSVVDVRDDETEYLSATPEAAAK